MMPSPRAALLLPPLLAALLSAGGCGNPGPARMPVDTSATTPAAAVVAVGPAVAPACPADARPLAAPPRRWA